MVLQLKTVWDFYAILQGFWDSGFGFTVKHKNIQTLNRGILVELIDTIWVHENGEITVDFNFADGFQRVVDYIENSRNILTVIENKTAV